MTVAFRHSGRWLAGALVLALALALADVLIGGRAFRIILLVVLAVGGALAVLLVARFRRFELDAEQAGVLAEMGALLDSTLDYQATLRNVARITVPRVADWCVL